MNFELTKSKETGKSPKTFAEEVAAEQRKQVSTGGENRHGDFILRQGIERSVAGMDPMVKAEGEAKMAAQLRAELAKIDEEIAVMVAGVETLKENLAKGQAKMAESTGTAKSISEEVAKLGAAEIKDLEVKIDLLTAKKSSLETDLGSL